MKQLSPKDVAEMCRLREEGQSLRAIASEFGVSRETVRVRTADVGEKLRIKRANRLHEDWADVSIAAEALGITEAAVVVACESRQIPGAVRIGKAWLIPRSQLPK